MHTWTKSRYCNQVKATDIEQDLFENIKTSLSEVAPLIGTSEVNHIVVNLYLIITGARRGFLLEAFHGYSAEVLKKVLPYINKYNLHISEQNALNYYLISNETIDQSKMRDEMYLAYMLEYGCFDPNYGDLRQPRIVYFYSVDINGESYYIMSYVCTFTHEVPEHIYLYTAQKFNNQLMKVDAQAEVNVQIKNVAPFPIPS